MSRFSASACGVRAVPITQPPLCEGRQTTVLEVENDAYYALQAQLATPRGWKSMGLVDPSNRLSFWRQSGETWRLFDPALGRVVASVITGGRRTVLYAPRSSAPIGYRPVERHELPSLI